jgi:2-isopropylmalate synthase
VRLEYSPESFTGTELDFAREICLAVMNVWEPSATRKMILNLPATVEMATPNVYADQIEWFGRNVGPRDAYLLSVHPHNDRGTAVAAAELAQMAGCERVEGTLFGNGERTGNVDVITLALNLFSQGIDPGLDLTNVPEIVQTVEYCNRLAVPERHPYGGELVFTAFSGSHQDAIKKGFAAREARGDEVWDVPYLPVDPEDLGRTYEAVIRINSQSGKGGVAYVMLHDFGYDLPRAMQIEFGKMVQAQSEASGTETEPSEIRELFESEYLAAAVPIRLVDYHVADDGNGRATIEATIGERGGIRTIYGQGNGPIDALVDALRRDLVVELSVRDYHEHAVGGGADAAAVAYVEVVTAGKAHYGVGRDPNIVRASLLAVVAGFDRAIRRDNLRVSGLRGGSSATVATSVADTVGAERSGSDEGENAAITV